MLVPAVLHLCGYGETSVQQLLFASGVTDVQYAILQHQPGLVGSLNFIFSSASLLFFFFFPVRCRSQSTPLVLPAVRLHAPSDATAITK